MTVRKSEDFEDRLQHALRSEVEAPLAQDIEARLATIRRQAVTAADDRNDAGSRWGGRWLIWSGMTAATAGVLFAVVVALQDPAPPFPVFEEQAFAAAADLELLEQLEFLAWLELEADGGAG